MEVVEIGDARHGRERMERQQGQGGGHIMYSC